MPPKNKLARTVKEAKFIEALVDHAGQTGKAYKAIRPDVTHHSARALGSRQLAEINKDDVNALCERIGCTKEAVVTGLWDRMKDAKTSDYIKGTSVLAKITGWDTKTDRFKDLLNQDMDLIEIVKVRLRKSSNVNEIKQEPIDIAPS